MVAKNLVLACHQGLGDHLVCNAIYRKVSKGYDHVFLPVAHRYYTEISKMMRAELNIQLIRIRWPSWRRQIEELTKIAGRLGIEVMKLGYFDTKLSLSQFASLDQLYYAQANMNILDRWDNFSYERDLEEERRINDYFNIQKSPYVFLHEDTSRGFTINRAKLPSNIRVLEPKKGLTSIFNYRGVIENSLEIHCIESSFSVLADMFDLREKKLVIHRYSRPEVQNDFRHQLLYRNRWEIIPG